MSYEVEAGVIGTIVAAIVGAKWQPWSDDSKARRARKRRNRRFINGFQGDGVVPSVFDAAKRLSDCEGDIKTLILATDERFEQLALQLKNHMEFGDRRAEKTHRALSRLIGVVKETNDRSERLERMWTKNGGQSNQPGDIQYRQALSQGLWNEEEDDEASPEAEH